MGGDFVVKKTNGAFNQVHIDQATEWVNKLCKLSNGIIGITRTDSARDCFCITWGERAIISEATKYLLGIGDEDESFTTHKDSFLSRTSEDEADVKSLVEQFERFGIFSVCRSKGAAVYSHFSQGAARVDVVFDRYIGTQSIKSQTRVKRGLRAKKPVRKVVSNGLVPQPQVWAQFISLSENNADLAAFLSEYFVKRFPNVPAGCELVLGGALSAQNFIIQPRKSSCIDL